MYVLRAYGMDFTTSKVREKLDQPPPMSAFRSCCAPVSPDTLSLVESGTYDCPVHKHPSALALEVHETECIGTSPFRTLFLPISRYEHSTWLLLGLADETIWAGHVALLYDESRRVWAVVLILKGGASLTPSDHIVFAVRMLMRIASGVLVYIPDDFAAHREGLCEREIFVENVAVVSSSPKEQRNRAILASLLGSQELK